MRTLLTAKGGCGCGKPKPTDVFEPTPKPKISIYQNTNPSSLTSSTTSGRDLDEDFTSITISETDTIHHHDNNNNSTKNHSISKSCPKLIDSIAVEKDSNDPYKDFRHSMLQMMFEKEIYSENDLQELLQCFLQLNAPCHHHVIVQAFTEICEETFPKKFYVGGAEPSRRNHIVGKSRWMMLLVMLAQPCGGIEFTRGKKLHGFKLVSSSCSGLIHSFFYVLCTWGCKVLEHVQKFMAWGLRLQIALVVKVSFW